MPHPCVPLPRSRRRPPELSAAAPPPPRGPVTLATWTLGVGLFGASAVACDDGGRDPSLLAGPQILAVQVDPRAVQPGEAHTISALVHDLGPDELVWQACPAPWLPQQGEPVCPVDGATIPLGTGNPITLTAPEELTAVWLRVDAAPADAADTDPTPTPAILAVQSGEPIPHPLVTSFLFDPPPPGDRPSDALTVLAAGETVAVTAVTTDPVGEGGQVVTFFTTGGSFESWRTLEGASTTFVAPEEEGDVTVHAIVRDPRGGVGWRTGTIRVTAATEAPDADAGATGDGAASDEADADTGDAATDDGGPA